MSHHRHTHTHGLDLADWSTRFDLLGDPTRLALLAHMHDVGPGVATVAALANSAGITRNAASKALRVLREQGWVRADPDPDDGRGQLYSLADDTVHRILHLMGARHD